MAGEQPEVFQGRESFMELGISISISSKNQEKNLFRK